MTRGTFHEEHHYTTQTDAMGRRCTVERYQGKLTLAMFRSIHRSVEDRNTRARCTRTSMENATCAGQWKRYMTLILFKKIRSKDAHLVKATDKTQRATYIICQQ